MNSVGNASARFYCEFVGKMRVRPIVINVKKNSVHVVEFLFVKEERERMLYQCKKNNENDKYDLRVVREENRM